MLFGAVLGKLDWKIFFVSQAIIFIRKNSNHFWKAKSNPAISQITSSGRALMYSRKSVGQRMKPWGTLALTQYSCEDFPSRTTPSHLLLRKEEVRPNIWPEIP